MSQEQIEEFLAKNDDRKFTAEELEAYLQLSQSTLYNNLKHIREQLRCKKCEYTLRGDCMKCRSCGYQNKVTTNVRYASDPEKGFKLYWSKT